MRLTSLVNELTEQVGSLKQNVAREVTNVVLKDVDTKLSTLESKMNTKINDVEKKCETQFEILGKQYAAILCQMSANSSNILAAIKGSQVTPSGDESSARGGAV